MIRFIAFALFALLGISPAFAASEGWVVTTCPATGTLYTIPGYAAVSVDVNGNTCIIGNITTTPATPAPGTAGAGYPPGATPVANGATGTTAGTSAVLPAAAGKFTYLCGLHVEVGSATAAIPVTITTSNTNFAFISSANAPVTAATATAGPIVSQVFTPCVPTLVVNSTLPVSASALGAGGVNQNVNAWGFQQ